MKFIVTTTINKPTEATLEFCKKQDWQFVIVGDTKTPEALYRQLENEFSNVEYLSVSEQESLYPQLSKIIGWQTIQRRNIGFVHAWKKGAEIVATVDDDNIPYPDWGKNFIGKNVVCDYWTTANDVFDPLSVTEYKNLWHRGFPVEILHKKNDVTFAGKKEIHCLIQADLWDGDPDIDAICRLAYKPVCAFKKQAPFAANKISPFNSQNTFLSRVTIPYYSVWPFVGRMDDIWAGYSIQMKFKENLIYCPASVYQNRNPQDLIKNLENEIIGYRNTMDFVKSNCSLSLKAIPDKTKQFIDIYQKNFE